LLAWPHDPTTWVSGVEHAEQAFAQLAAAISQAETVHLLVRDEAMERRASPLLSAAGARDVRLHKIETADAWFRDYGPITVVKDQAGGRARLALDFVFNAWGGKYPELFADSNIPKALEPILGIEAQQSDFVLEGGSIEGNGRGSLLTTEQCLLNPNRNPHMGRAEIEAMLRGSLGVTNILWLGEGIAGDDTDGHVDDLTRFVRTDTILTAVQPDAQDPDHAPLAENLKRLRSLRDEEGRPFTVIELPMPAAVLSSAGERLPASYANFYIANGVVCVPVFGQVRDEEALKILARCFPDREIVPIRSEHVVEGLGSLHCVTQQVPAG
jgi:agmatine deiminase